MKGVSSATKTRTKKDGTVTQTVYWYATINGKKKYFGAGSRGKKLATAARANSVARAYEKRDSAAGFDVNRCEFDSVGEMLSWYMDLPQIKRQKSYSRKQAAWRQLVIHFDTVKTKLRDFTLSDIDDYISSRREQGRADRTINVDLSLLSNAYALAMKYKKIHRDYVPGGFVLAQKDMTEVPRPVISDEQFDKLKNAATGDFKDMLILAYETAMRSTEICDLRASQVHLDVVVSDVPPKTASYIHLGIFDTKNRTERVIPLSGPAQEMLEKRIEGLHPEDHLFLTDNAQPFSNTLVSEIFKRVCARAEIIHGDNVFDEQGNRVGIVFHGLRHARTTKWVKLGLSDEIIRRATGHKSLAAYQKYIHLDPTDLMVLVNGRKHLGEKVPKRGKTGEKTPKPAL
jgi:integrase